MRRSFKQGLIALTAISAFIALSTHAHGLPIVGQVIGTASLTTPFHHVDGVNDITGLPQRIAILDTGVQYNHPALSGTIVGGINFSASAGWAATTPAAYTDGHGHGTFVAGIIASQDVGRPGIAPDVEIISVRVAASNGQASFNDIAAGLEWVSANAAALNITTVNLSMGSASLYETESDVPNWTTNRRLADAFAALKMQDVVTVVASGNNGSTTHLTLPAIFDDVVAVGAATKLDAIWTSTNRNATLELLAPGVSVASLWRNNGLATGTGTSYAAPVVAATSMLLRDAYEYFTDNLAGDFPTFQDRVVDLMQRTGTPIYDSATGLTFSRVDLDAALHGIYAEFGANVSVPEPAALFLLAMGFIVIGHRRQPRHVASGHEASRVTDAIR